jgi:TetR/AcrR family transcriptional repressor of nem operon
MARTTDTRDRLLEAAHQLLWEQSLGAASVDAICEKAGVQKGSFYHFFKSKEELIAASLEANFAALKLEYDRIFSPTRPPIQRLKDYFEFKYRHQARVREQTGRVLGCPLASAGSACSMEDRLIRDKVQEVHRTGKKYLETTIRDGQADGSIPVKDVPAAVESVFAYIEGVLTVARIQNDLKPLKNLGKGVFALLGLTGKRTPTPAKS